jgi:hypothetical protein
MILKVAVPRFLGPVRETNLRGAQPARSSTNVPTLANAQPFITQLINGMVLHVDAAHNQ